MMPAISPAEVLRARESPPAWKQTSCKGVQLLQETTRNSAGPMRIAGGYKEGNGKHPRRME